MKTGAILTLLLLAFSMPESKGVETIVVGGFDGLNPIDKSGSAPILLALSGGGARGLAAIGVLQAFEERNIKIAGIAGTSMGGIVGGLYASGYSADELFDIVESIRFHDLFASSPSRASMFLSRRQGRERHLVSIRFDGLRPRIPKALTAAQRLTTLLTNLTTRSTYRANGDFTKFPIPFSTIGTDIITGQEVVLDSGSLANAMRATMAFPLAFTGIEIDGHLLMDGGMLRPVPVDLAKKLSDSVDFVVAINTTSPLRKRQELVTPVDIANQVTSIMIADKLEKSLSLANYVITPPLDELRSTDFGNKAQIIAIGRRIGLSAADSILTLLNEREKSARFTPIGGSIDGLALSFEDSPFNQTMTRSKLVEIMKQFTIEHDLFRLEVLVNQLPDHPPRLNDTTIPVQLTFRVEQAAEIDKTRIRFTGNQSFDDSTLLMACDFEAPILTAIILRRILDRIINHYRVEGFDLADIRTVEYDSENRIVTIDIDEALIRRIDVSHNQSTRDWLVRSYFPMKVGEPYSTDRASKGIASIYGTDLFDRVNLNLKQVDSGVIVDIGVNEKPYLQTRIGWHWDDEYDSEEFVELLTDNAHGIGLEYLVHARFGKDRQRYSAGLKADRIFSSYATARFRLYHERLDRTTFDSNDLPDGSRNEQKTGGNFSVGQQISRLGTVEAGLIFEHVVLEDSRFPERNAFDLRTIRLQSEVERFDRISFPRTGQKFLFQLNLTGKLFGGDIEYTRIASSLENYFPIGQRLNYHQKFSIGLSRSGLPPSEQFYIGGLHSLSGLRIHQLSGDKMLLLNQELRLSLPLRSYLSILLDIGNVYASTDQIKLDDLRKGWAASLGIDSPLGPFEFGYGHDDRNNDRFYFRAGYAF